MMIQTRGTSNRTQRFSPKLTFLCLRWRSYLTTPTAKTTSTTTRRTPCLSSLRIRLYWMTTRTPMMTSLTFTFH